MYNQDEIKRAAEGLVWLWRHNPKELQRICSEASASMQKISQSTQQLTASPARSTPIHESPWEKIFQHPSVNVISGWKGAGKTAFGCRLLESFHNRMKLSCYVYRVPDAKRSILPRWINVINRLEDLANGVQRRKNA